MSRVTFYVPELKDNKAWLDYRNKLSGGYGWRSNINLNNYYYVALHHTVTNPTGNAKKDIEYIHKLHKNRGWGGIGYNFIVTSEDVKGKDGETRAKVGYVGDLGSMRAHTPNMKGSFGLKKGYGNMHIIGISIVGRFDQGKPPTDAQILSVHELVKELIWDEDARLINIKNTWRSMKGHKDFDPTACPGDLDAIRKSVINIKKLPKDFDPAVYLELNKDVAKAGYPPKVHYILHGKSEGRKYKKDTSKPTTGETSEKPDIWKTQLTRLGEISGYRGEENPRYIADHVAARISEATTLRGDLRARLEDCKEMSSKLLDYDVENKEQLRTISYLQNQINEITKNNDKAFWNRVGSMINNLLNRKK